MVEYLLDKGANIDVRNKEGRTPLHVAIRAKKGDLDLIKIFVDNNAYLTSRDTLGYTLLDEAIQQGKLEIAQFLILQGVQAAYLNKGGWTLLHYAAKDGMFEFVKFVLQKQPDMINSKNERGETPLMVAVKGKGDLKMVEYFIEKGANVTTVDVDGVTLLHEAALADKVDVARKLVTRDVNSVNSVNKAGFTPFQSAVFKDNLEVVKFLFDKQNDSFALTKESKAKFPIELAKQNDAKRVFQFLLSARNKAGSTMLHEMAKQGNVQMVTLLLDNGAVVDELNNDKLTALQLASKHGHLNVVKYLVTEKCANIEFKNDKGQSAVFLAEQEGKQSVVTYLLDNKKLVNAITKGNVSLVKQLASQGIAIKCPIRDQKWTSLHLAASEGQLEIVKLLIQKGVSLFDLTSDGQSPLDLALQAEKKNVVSALKDYTKLLIVAINANNFEKVKQHIKDGADVNAKGDERGNTSLHVAAGSGKFPIVKYLVESGGSNIHAENNDKRTPLDLAIQGHHQPVADYLIERTRVELYDAITANNIEKVKSHIREWDIVKGNDVNGWTALHVAAYHGYPDIVQYLLENGASTNVKAIDGSTPLDLARKREKREVVRSLVNTANNQGSFMLHEAAGRGDLRSVSSLIENNAGVNAKNTKGETPIQVAVKNSGSLELIQFLKNNGADIQTRDQSGASVLFNAIISGKTDIVKYLIEQGADVNAANNDGFTPLHETVSKDNFKLTKYLLSQSISKVNVNSKNSNGKTALHLVISERGTLDMAVLLVQSGANIQIKDKNNRSLVLEAIMSDRYDIAEFLIGEGADLHSSSSDGWTPLHEAAKRGNANLVRLLLQNGADFNAKTKDSETPLEIADTFDKTDVVSLLVKFYDRQGQTMLHHAASKGEFSNVNYLLQKGSLVNALDNLGFMPIHLAAKSGQPGVASALVSQGANFCAKTKNVTGLTPLEIAQKSKDSKMIEFFESQALIPVINIMSLENNAIDKLKELIAKGTNVNCANAENGWTALHYAADAGNIAIVELLIKSGANTTALTNRTKQLIGTKDGVTPMKLAEKKKHSTVVQLLVDTIDLNLGLAQLHVAAQNGDIDTVKTLLKEKGAFVSVPNAQKLTPLHIAAAYNQLVVAKYLIKRNATIDAKSLKDETPLNYAINQKGDLKLVELFNEKGADLRVKDNNGVTYVSSAVSKGKIDIFSFLVQNGADFKLADKDGWTPLHIAAQKGNTEVIQSLVAKKVPMDVRNNEGKTPLHVAVSAASNKAIDDTIKLLLASSAKVNSNDNSGNSILLDAIMLGKLSIAKLIIEKSADVNVPNKNGWTALHQAAKIGDTDLINLLLTKNGNVNVKDQNQRTPLQVAVRETGQLSIAKLFISKGADVKIKDKFGSSLLIDAAIANSLPLVKEFMSKGVNVNAPNNEGNTPLHESAKHATVDLLRYLLNQSSNVNAKNKLGQTPLQVAVCTKGNLTNLVYFFAKNANVKTTDNRKSTLILDAVLLGKVDIVEFLIEKEANLNEENSDGFTPLHASAKLGNIELVELLLRNNARTDAKDQQGWTALHYAASGGWLVIVQKLVEKGANINLRNVDGKRPLDLVMDSKKFKIAKYLIAQKDIPIKAVPRVTRSIQMRKNTRLVRSVNESNIFEWSKLGAVTNSATKSPSLINLAVNSVLGAFKCVSDYVFASKPQFLPKDHFKTIESDFQNNNIDINSSLLLIDIAIRTITRQRYVPTVGQTMSLQDANSCALNIISEFEKLMNDLVKTTNLKIKQINFSFELYQTIERLLISGNYSKIPNALLDSSRQMCPGLKDNELFANIVSESIKQMLNNERELNAVSGENEDFEHYISQFQLLNTNNSIEHDLSSTKQSVLKTLHKINTF